MKRERAQYCGASPSVLKVMSKPSLSVVGGSGSTEGGGRRAEETMYTQIAKYNNSHVLLVRCRHLVQHAHPVAYSSLVSKAMYINTNTICSSHTKCLKTLCLLQGGIRATLLRGNRAPIAVAAPCPSCGCSAVVGLTGDLQRNRALCDCPKQFVHILDQGLSYGKSRA